MRRTRPWLAVILMVVTVRCSSSHCADTRPQVLPDVSESAFDCETIRGHSRDFTVFKRGSGPPVVIFHELPGLSPATFRLGHLLSEAGFTVYLPLLFGSPSEYAPRRNFFRVCLNPQFRCFSKTTLGPIADEMKAVVDAIDARHGRAGVGAIGMCLTGALPLELVAKKSPIKAAVVAQPAMPLRDKRAVAVPANALREIDIPVLVTRFSEDGKSPRERLELLDAELENTTTIEIDSSPKNQFGFDKSSHAVLTSWFRNEPGHPTRDVLDRAIAMFRKALAE